MRGERAPDTKGVIRAVVFDLDGVLLDSERLWDQARREVTIQHNGHWRADATAAMLGMSSVEWSRYMRDNLGVDLPPDQIVDLVVADLLERYRRGLPLLPGAIAAVRRIRQRCPPKRCPGASQRPMCTWRPPAGSGSHRGPAPRWRTPPTESGRPLPRGCTWWPFPTATTRRRPASWPRPSSSSTASPASRRNGWISSIGPDPTAGSGPPQTPSGPLKLPRARPRRNSGRGRRRRPLRTASNRTRTAALHGTPTPPPAPVRPASGTPGRSRRAARWRQAGSRRARPVPLRCASGGVQAVLLPDRSPWRRGPQRR